MALAVLCLAALVVWARAEIMWGMLAAVLAVAVLVKRQDWGLYVMVALYPFIYWQIFIGAAVNVPYVDVAALLLFAAWAVKNLILYARGEKPLTSKNFPGLGLWILFLAAGVLSLINAPDWLLGLKYVLRPMGFFYLMFVILPYNLIRGQKVLKNVLWIMYGLGIVTALCGLMSLIWPEAQGLARRAVPFLVRGFNPLGTNHNVLAEVLIGVIPIGWLVVASDKAGRRKRWLMAGLALMVVINLLTFSRAGWLALLVEGLLVLVLYYRKYWRRTLAVVIAGLILLVPVGVLMGKFLNSAIVASSDANRWQLTEIAWQSFKQNPLIGAGAGSFMSLVARDKWYIIDFGTPLDAHGLVQKLIAETGLLGLLSFGALVGYIFWRVLRAYRGLKVDSKWRVVILGLGIAAVGSVFFQLFNTSYFIAKMWLPLGIALAACQVAESDKTQVLKTKN